MRHIKTYKLFESKSDIIDDIRDMLNDLNDEGYDTKVDDDLSYFIIIRIDRKSPALIANRKDFEVLNSVISRIKTYMKSHPEWYLQVDDLTDMGIYKIFDKGIDVNDRRHKDKLDKLKLFSQAPIKIKYEKR